MTPPQLPRGHSVDEVKHRGYRAGASSTSRFSIVYHIPFSDTIVAESRLKFRGRGFLCYQKLPSPQRATALSSKDKFPLLCFNCARIGLKRNFAVWIANDELHTILAVCRKRPVRSCWFFDILLFHYFQSYQKFPKLFWSIQIFFCHFFMFLKFWVKFLCTIL